MLLLLGCLLPKDELGPDPVIEGTLEGEALPEMLGGYWIDVEDGPYSQPLLDGGFAIARFTSYADACDLDTRWYDGLREIYETEDSYDAVETAETELHLSLFETFTAGVEVDLYAEDHAGLSGDFTFDDGLYAPGTAWAGAWSLTQTDGEYNSWTTGWSWSQGGTATSLVDGDDLALDFDADLQDQDTVYAEGVELRACPEANTAYTEYDAAYTHWDSIHGGC